jgi:hypothetical protein
MIQSVRIFGLDYKLVSMPVAVSEAIGALGEIDFEKLEIKICAGLPDQKETETILHEIFHGILEATGSEDIKDGEEALVNRLASGMNSVLRDNPELFKFLLSTWDAV